MAILFFFFLVFFAAVLGCIIAVLIGTIKEEKRKAEMRKQQASPSEVPDGYGPEPEMPLALAIPKIGCALFFIIICVLALFALLITSVLFFAITTKMFGG